MTYKLNREQHNYLLKLHNDIKHVSYYGKTIMNILNEQQYTSYQQTLLNGHIIPQYEQYKLR
jgi:hypothetical protein